MHVSLDPVAFHGELSIGADQKSIGRNWTDLQPITSTNRVTRRRQLFWLGMTMTQRCSFRVLLIMLNLLPSSINICDWGEA